MEVTLNPENKITTFDKSVKKFGLFFNKFNVKIILTKKYFDLPLVKQSVLWSGPGMPVKIILL